MSDERGRFPKAHRFAIAGLPPGGDQSITLSEEDEGILDKVWAEIRRGPSDTFGRPLPPLPERRAEGAALTETPERQAAEAAEAVERLTDGRDGAVAANPRRARKATPPATMR